MLCTLTSDCDSSTESSFSAVNHVTSENQRHRPSLTEYRNGVRAPLYQCLSSTLTERLQLVDLSSLGRISKVIFDFTWGLDGSGEHSNYNQLSKVHFTTKQVMSVCFSVKKITIEDRSGQIVTWSSSTEGSLPRKRNNRTPERHRT